MKKYNSMNTTVLMTHGTDRNDTRMLLLHKRMDGSIEYIIGSYFNATRTGWDEYDYDWYWGHYFDDLVYAVDYWKRNILCISGPERFLCPDCSGAYLEHPVELEYADGTWTCPECGCSTAFPEEDLCIRVEYEE